MRTLLGLAIAMAVLLGCSGGGVTETRSAPVEFQSFDGTPLIGTLDLPDGPGPHAAVVFLHGCSGLGRDGEPFATYTSWRDVLVQDQFAVLMVDSASGRGFASTCGQRDERRVMLAGRPFDAYASLDYLQSLDDIDPAAVNLMGWSQGGAIVLLTIVSESIGRPVPAPEHDFAKAVAMYPGSCSEQLQTEPFTTVEPGTWSTDVPLLVLHGAEDNWTLPGPCLDFITAARTRNQPVDIVVYQDALHSFDAPNLAIQLRLDAETADGEAPRVGTNHEARADALNRVPAFFATEEP